MKLGVHTYSLHLSGFGPTDPAGTEIQGKTMNVFGLLEYCKNDLGLDGVHLTPLCLDAIDLGHMREVGARARELGLFLEYNFSMDDPYVPQINLTPDQALNHCQALGADIAKASLDVKRPRPLTASRHHPKVMEVLARRAKEFRAAAPRARELGVRFAIENHTDTYASEIKWLVAEVDHPAVGACVDTGNALFVMEDPVSAYEILAPIAFTNHFKDYRVDYAQYGARFVGVALGEGDIDMVKAYHLIKNESATDRLIIEVEWDPAGVSPEQARAEEIEALKRSIDYCRNVLLK